MDCCVHQTLNFYLFSQACVILFTGVQYPPDALPSWMHPHPQWIHPRQWMHPLPPPTEDIRSTGGHHASYWNAYLFFFFEVSLQKKFKIYYKLVTNGQLTTVLRTVLAGMGRVTFLETYTHKKVYNKLYACIPTYNLGYFGQLAPYRWYPSKYAVTQGEICSSSCAACCRKLFDYLVTSDHPHPTPFPEFESLAENW